MIDGVPRATLGTVQPEWDDLPFVCDVNYEYFRRGTVDDGDIHDQDWMPSKSDGVTRLLRELGFVEDDELTTWGSYLAEVYQEPTQTALPGRGPVKGKKKTLGQLEQLVLWSALYHENAVPMLAAFHQVATERVPTAQKDQPSDRFGSRIEHLYEAVDSESSWMPRAKTHYKWLKQLNLSEVSGSEYVLSGKGERVFRQVRPVCPDEWDRIGPDPVTTLDEFQS